MPDSPQLPILDRRITAFNAQLESERSQTAGETDSLAPKVGEYESLLLKREIGAKTLETSITALEEARVEARRKQLYLDRVVSPNAADRPGEPKRLLSILTVFVATFVAYGILSLFIAGLREHRQH